MFNPATYMVSNKHFFIFSNLGSFLGNSGYSWAFLDNMEYFHHLDLDLDTICCWLCIFLVPILIILHHQRKFLEIRLRTGTLAHQRCDLGCFFSTGYSKRVFHISSADWTFALSFGLYLLCPYNLALSTRSFESLKFKKAADCTFSVFIINSKACCSCETRLDLCNKEAGRGKERLPAM